MDQLIKPKTIGGFVRSLSGLFITPENPQGVTPTECTIIAMLIGAAINRGTRTVNKEVKIAVANESNSKVQVVTNYVNKFKKKGVITKSGELHSIFFAERIIIDGKDFL